MSDQEQRDGSILVRIDGRLDTVELEAPLWNNLRAHVNGSMAEFPDSPVYVDLRKVVYADPRCVKILDSVLDEARSHTPVVFLGPGPGLEAMFAITGDFILDPLRMFAPWEEDELTGLAALDEPDQSTLGPQATKEDAVASALSNVMSDVEEEDQFIPAYEEPACFQPVAPKSLFEEEDSAEEAFEINLDIEKAHLEASEGLDRSSREATLQTSGSQWKPTFVSGPGIEPGASPAQDTELLQTLARLEKRNRELEEKTRQQESRLEAERKELDYQRSLTDQERRRVHEESQAVQAQIEQDRQRAQAEIEAREEAIEKNRIAAAKAAIARKSELEAELNEKLVDLDHQTSELERSRDIESGKAQQRRIEIERERQRIAEMAEKQQHQLESERRTSARELERDREALDDQRQALEAKAEELDQREKQFQVEVPNSAANWLEGARVGTAEGVVLREEFLALIDRFTTQGFVDPDEVAAFVTQVDSLAVGISTNLSRLLPHCGEKSREAHWGGLLLMTSTLAREETDSDQRRVSLTAALLGTLVQHAPGCQPKSGEVGQDIESHVLRLLDSGFCQLQSGFSSEAVTLDLAVWRAGLKIASAETLSPHSWGHALSQMLSGLDAEDPACQGLPRILSTHSVFMPGSWVELSNGVFGQVMGAADGKAERPKVLVMFEFDGTRARPISPRLFPDADEGHVTVRRVLDENEFVSLGAG